MPVYDDLSRIYDTFMDNIDYKAWAAFVLQQLDMHIAPGGQVVDMGCGTGAMSIPVAQAGYRVLAADASEAMLMQAGENARQNGVQLELVQADARSFTVGKPVDAIIAVCDVVNYLLAEEDVRSFLRSAYTALKPGGLLLFDISSEAYLRDTLGQGTYMRETDQSVYVMNTTFEAGVSYMDVLFFDEEPDGRYVRMEEQHQLAAHKQEDIQRYLHEEGYANIRLRSDEKNETGTICEQRLHFTAQANK